MKHSPDTISSLADTFERTALVRPMRVTRYEPGTELAYDITGVAVARPAQMRVRVEGFVGGGFAGQVYRVKLLSLDSPQGDIPNLTVGGCYAIKILIPPSRGARAFRDLIYRVGFQSPFSLQVNPAAARSGALWQTLIRRAARMRFGDERAVTEIHATFVDHTLGSCGEISEWIDGRTWRLEVDDRLGARRQWKPGQPHDDLGSPEYLTKREFMAGIVKLLHDMGAPELARQYEWWTCKSQPNCLKRTDSEGDPETGLTAVDFRAGLALLPVLPMSPGDVPLIFKGLARGSVVQFDRGDVAKLESFVEAHKDAFEDMGDALAELKESERVYRDSVPDITHNHVRLLGSRRLWSTMFDRAVTGWRVRNIADEACASRLRASRLLTVAFLAVGMIGPLAVAGAIAWFIAAVVAGLLSWPLAIGLAGMAFTGPIVSRLLRRFWGRADYRKNYKEMLTSPSYLRRATRAMVFERLIAWHRSGRIGRQRARSLARRPRRFLLHLPLSILPGWLHRVLTDRRYLRKKLHYIFVRPLRLYFNADARERWLREMLSAGRTNGMLSDEDAELIESQIKEPFIQKYLKALAVHVCTLPVTQIVSVIVAAWYKVANNLTWGEAWDEMVLILFAFQVTPISPGSLVRGFYVLYLVIRERNFKDYNIAVFLGFFKYIGYLAFPIQMTYRYPALARFMAAHWATGAARIVPVFGERGALLEHGVFNWFYNWPLTIRRRMRRRARLRSQLPPRNWHVPPTAAAAAAVFLATDAVCYRIWGAIPQLHEIWAAGILIPLLAGAVVTLAAGGAVLQYRLLYALSCGALAGVIYATVHVPVMIAHEGGATIAQVLAELATATAWRVFAFGVFAAIGAMITEMKLPEPRRQSLAA